MRYLFIFCIGFFLSCCGALEEYLNPPKITVFVKEPASIEPPGVRGPINPPTIPIPGRGGLTGGGNKSQPQPNPAPDPAPIPKRPVEPIPDPPIHKLPGDLYGEDDFWSNDSGRHWVWCHKIPETLMGTPIDEYWGWVPKAAEWCERWNVYQVDGGCTCRIKS